MSNMLQGIVYLTPEQYETLVNEGVITVNGKTIAYNKNTLYITKNNNPSTSVEGFYDPNTGIVYAKGLELNGVDINTIINNKIAESGSGADLSGIQTQIDEIKANKKYLHNIVHRIGSTAGEEYSIAVFNWINNVAEPYTVNNFNELISEIKDKGHVSPQTHLLANGYETAGGPDAGQARTNTVIGVYVDGSSFYLTLQASELEKEEILIDGESKNFGKSFKIYVYGTWKGSQTIGGLRIDDMVTEL